MNIGPTEIIVVLALALLVFGPGKLPQMGRTLGRGVREFKQAAQTAKDELGLSEVLDDVNAVKSDVTASVGVDELKASLSDVTSTIDDAKASMGVNEITAGVGSVKAAIAFDPKRAAKDLVTGKRAAGTPAAVDAGEKAASVAGEGTDSREPVPCDAAEDIDAAVDAEADADTDADAEPTGAEAEPRTLRRPRHAAHSRGAGLRWPSLTTTT